MGYSSFISGLLFGVLIFLFHLVLAASTNQQQAATTKAIPNKAYLRTNDHQQTHSSRVDPTNHVVYSQANNNRPLPQTNNQSPRAVNEVNHRRPSPPKQPEEDDGGNHDGSRYIKTFDCRTHQAWELDYNDNAQVTIEFQNWLTYRQNLCYDYPDTPYMQRVPTYGYTAALQFSAASMIDAIQQGEIMAPVKQLYVFAYSNVSRCSRQVATVDCFNLPLTTCRYNTNNTLADSRFYNATAANEFLANGTNMDICHQGIRAKKPLLWVFGQYFLFNLRLPPLLNQRRDEDAALIMNLLQLQHERSSVFLHNNNSSHSPSYAKKKMHYHHSHNYSYKKSACLTAAIQVRSGNSDGRSFYDGSAHLTELTRINQDLLQDGYTKGICSVYVATGDPNSTVFAKLKIGTPDYIPSYSQSMTFLIMPRFLGNPKMEFEYQMAILKQQPDFDPWQLYLEFLVDLQVMIEADIYLGSESSFMHVVAGIRYTRDPYQPNNHTCFMGSTREFPPGKKVCVGSEDFKVYWRNRWHKGGVNGGSIFFHQEESTQG